MSNTPLQAGKTAYENGYPITINPHRLHTIAAAAWDRGWMTIPGNTANGYILIAISAGLRGDNCAARQANMDHLNYRITTGTLRPADRVRAAGTLQNLRLQDALGA